MARTVGIIGLGLLGASLAKALRAYTTYDVIGYARRQEICDLALADGGTCYHGCGYCGLCLTTTDK